MTYEITKEIANGNKELLVLTFAKLTKEAMNCGLSQSEAKIESKAILNCMVNAWNSTQDKFNN
jgi:hypothetical protein